MQLPGLSSSRALSLPTVQMAVVRLLSPYSVCQTNKFHPIYVTLREWTEPELNRYCVHGS